MWPRFTDCQECVPEEDYVCCMQDEWSQEDIDRFLKEVHDAKEPEPEPEPEVWCEVGEHYVPTSMMWPQFGDCQECVDEEKYVEYMLECYPQEEIDGFLKDAKK